MNFSNLLLYADDVKLLTRVNSRFDQERLQVDLDAIIEWSKVNDLNLNVDKCLVLIFHRGVCLDTHYCLNDAQLTKVTKIKDLGVLFKKISNLITI